MAGNAEATDWRAGYRLQGESVQNFQYGQDRQRDVRERMTLADSTGPRGNPWTFERTYKDEEGNPYPNVFTTEYAEDGRTLLEFVVYSRRPEKDIRKVVEDIIDNVGLDALVFQLQKSDTWGAPLLFQAVSGKPLGQSALSSSLQGISFQQGGAPQPGTLSRQRGAHRPGTSSRRRKADRRSAWSQQSAARQTRAKCLAVVAETISWYLGRVGLAEQLRSVDRKGRSLRMYAARSREDGLYEEVEKLMKKYDVLDNLEHRDHRGYTLLHHAAESGSLATLTAVTKSLKMRSDFCGKFSGKKDSHGMTPVHRLLSKQVGEGEFAECQKKLKHLINVCTCPKNSQGDLDNEGVIFAARGGMVNLNLAIPQWKNASVRRNLELIFGHGSVNKSQVERFLVQAALGGQTDVLQAVLKDESLLPEHGDQFRGNGVQSPGNEDVIAANEGATSENGGTIPGNGGASPDDGDTDRDGRRGEGGGADREGSLWDSLNDPEAVMKRTDFRFAAIELGSVGDDPEGEGGNPGGGQEVCEGSLFTLTILSGKDTAISWAKDFTLQHVKQKTEAWEMIRGKGCISSLTYAASAPPETDTAAFEAVLTALKEVAKQAKGVEGVEDTIRQEFEGGGDKCCKRERVRPLAAAAFCGNDKLFQEVEKAYSTGLRGTWSPREVIEQLLIGTLIRRESSIRRESLSRGKPSTPVCQQEIRFLPRDGGDEAQIPFAMWGEIMSMVIKVQRSHHSRRQLLDGRRSEPLAEWKASFTGSIKQAVGQGAFEDLRALIRMKFRMEDIIPSLLASIGDNEEKLTSTIMCAIKHSSNPFIMCAVASRHIMDTKGTLPAHREGLDCLQAKIDEFMVELLNRLPKTVRGFGRKLVGARPPTTYEKSSDEWRKRRERLSYLVGYITVRQLLEPNQSHTFRDDNRAVECESLDPIQQAMERGSGALYFINSPLVLDYMHITFSRTLPHWLARDPFRYPVNTGFHEYFLGFRIRGENSLLRTMQGCDARWTGELRMPESAFPSRMILPGLQFSLAGIIGKPDAFFMVPAVRFVFTLWSYVVTVGLYVSCLPPEDSNRIPPNEIAFYIFGLGLLYREVLEFQETLPHQKLIFNPGDSLSKGYEWPLKRRYTPAPHRVPVALKRYLFHDTWNILDILMVFTILVALVTRLMGMGGRWRSGDEYEDDDSATDDASLEFARWAFFFSRYALATVAPMLFARFLFLSQIDPTLGPMTQVIWTMIFHLVRFSFFLLVHLIGFTLTFYALFSECKGDLGDRFETFSKSLLTLFGSMLGDFDFDIFSDEYSSCEGSSYAAYDIGILLMVVYLVVMTILLLNLLIAVLSTAHSEVHKNTVLEFNLAAGKIILKNAKAVAQGIVPPPFNLLMVVIGLLVDTAGLLYWLPSTLRNICGEKKVSTAAIPFSGKSWWFPLEGLLLRIFFALSMGLSSIVIYAFLWVISTPLIAWRAFQTVCPPGFGQKDEGIAWKAGYLGPLLATLGSLAGWMVAMLVVSLYSLVHMFFLILLWLRGLLSTIESYRSCRRQEGEREESLQEHQHQHQHQHQQDEQHQREHRQTQSQRQRDPRRCRASLASPCFSGCRTARRNYASVHPLTPPTQEDVIQLAGADATDERASVPTDTPPVAAGQGLLGVEPDGSSDVSALRKARSSTEHHQNSYENERCAIMPGGESFSSDDWSEATRIVREYNHPQTRDFGPECFNLDDFLMMTTGRSVADLIQQVERRDKEGGQKVTNDREGRPHLGRAWPEAL